MPCQHLVHCKRHLIQLLKVSTLLLLAGCTDKSDPEAGRQAAPPPSVIAVRATSGSIEDQSEFVGRVVAVDKVELRARVQGFLKKRSFTEGQEVKVGDVLFEIEPDQYEAIVEQREADLAKAKADQLNTAAQLKRGLELLKDKNIAQAKVDELQAADSIALASIEQAKAALNAAKLDLGYTRVTAPAAGRIGLAKYPVGNLVGPASEPLSTIVSRDPIYLQFPLTQRKLFEARQDIKAKGGDAKHVVVRARLPDGTLYDQPGRLNFIDVTTDQGTDSVTLRAELPNPDGTLVDGQFVGVVLQAGVPDTAILIPQSALQVDQQGTFVLIIDAEGKAQIRRVQIGAPKGPQVAVKSGLKEGELVISEGIQKVRPGQAVTATPPQGFKAADQPAAASVPEAKEKGTAKGDEGAREAQKP